MGKKRKHESNSSETEEFVSPNRKKSKKIVDAPLKLNKGDFEIWMVKKPNCISAESLTNCDFSSGDFQEFNYDESSFDCEKQPLQSRSIILFQKDESSHELLHEKVEIEPKGSFVISRVLPKKVISLEDVESDKGPPPMEEGLKQRFVPFGIYSEVVPKEKLKKKKRSHKR